MPIVVGEQPYHQSLDVVYGREPPSSVLDTLSQNSSEAVEMQGEANARNRVAEKTPVPLNVCVVTRFQLYYATCPVNM
jgi:hypothetical protein